MTHTARVPLRWSDLDAVGHLNNAVYLTLCEQARIEALALVDGAWTDAATPVVVQATVTFRRPITTPGVAVVEVRFGLPGRTSLPTSYVISLEGDDGGTCADAGATLVWIDPRTGRPVPVPDALRERVAGERPSSVG